MNARRARERRRAASATAPLMINAPHVMGALRSTITQHLKRSTPKQCDEQHKGPWTLWADDLDHVFCARCALAYGLDRIVRDDAREDRCDVCGCEPAGILPVVLISPGNEYLVAAGVCPPCRIGMGQS